MKAMVLHQQAEPETGPLRLEDRPTPAPGRGEILLRVLSCGVCHTDLHIVRGDLPLRRRPVVPGHQIVGRVVALGEGVDAPDEGTRVGVPWLSTTCGECRQCRAGRENLCPSATFTGWDRDGGFAEAVVVPAGSAHRLPDVYDDIEAAPLLCAGVIGYRSLRLAGVVRGHRIGLFGFGASAHLALQMARRMGAEVLVFTRSEEHRQLARELGAVWAGSATDEIDEPLDCAVTFAPVGWVAREALRLVGPGGTVAINAIHLDEIPALDYERHLYQERVLRSVANLTHADAREFLALAGDRPVRSIAEAFPLESANDVLRRMATSGIEAAAVLVPS
jgi:propanol-preferring alcohol dehydrogenase